MDPNIEQLARYRKSKTGRSRGHNAARDFNRWVHRRGKAYPVQITDLKVPVPLKATHKSGRKKTRFEDVNYPVIHLSSWLTKIMETCPRFWLGGYDPNLSNDWMDMFQHFWLHFEGVHPQHPIYSEKSSEDRKVTIPLAIHGDEGRGLGKKPVLILSFQIMIPSTGPNKLNSDQHLSLKKGTCVFVFYALLGC